MLLVLLLVQHILLGLNATLSLRRRVQPAKRTPATRRHMSGCYHKVAVNRDRSTSDDPGGDPETEGHPGGTSPEGGMGC